MHTVTREYCNMETFEASCPDGSLVVIDNAYYGRPRPSRCVTLNLSVGCGEDVLTILDSHCSGRRKCRVQLPEERMYRLVHARDCLKDVEYYLEASYSCLPGGRKIIIINFTYLN